MIVAPVALVSVALSLAAAGGLIAAGGGECAGVSGGLSSVRVEYDSRVSAAGRAGTIIFAPSSVGELNALDADSGSLLWTFVPPEVPAATAHVDLMTDVTVLRFDANGDGVIDAAGGDRVWLYFGLKRAGAYYYALDVTRRTPRVLWTAGAAALAGLAQAWSTPTVARVRVAGASQNGEHFVVIVGGGFSRDSSAAGNHIFMLDASSGRLLWSAGADADSDLALAHMTHGIAARVAALDIDGDGFADRLYTADVGGRVWRFDVWNGHARDALVTGGMFASLGTAEPLPTPAALPGQPTSPGVPGSQASDARRFFTAPDVALMQSRGQNPWYNLAIGSGDGDDVRSTTVRNRFYSLRDREPFAMRAQSDYDSALPVMDVDLTDITATAAGVPDDSPGWRLDLPAGESVLAEPVTANGTVMFTTHEPGASIDGSLCASDGTNRVYSVRVDSGAAALDLNDDARIDDADRSAVLEQKGIAPGVRIEMPGQSTSTAPPVPGAPGSQPTAAATPPTTCLVGTELLNQCVPLDAVLRTFWKRTLSN
jgi:type IV pilus assembly protein PilY1